MTLTDRINAQSQAAQADKALAQREAISRNAEIRRTWSSEANATRPLTLNEWRQVKPNIFRRWWKRLTTRRGSIWRAMF